MLNKCVSSSPIDFEEFNKNIELLDKYKEDKTSYLINEKTLNKMYKIEKDKEIFREFKINNNVPNNEIWAIKDKYWKEI